MRVVVSGKSDGSLCALLGTAHTQLKARDQLRRDRAFISSPPILPPPTPCPHPPICPARKAPGSVAGACGCCRCADRTAWEPPMLPAWSLATRASSRQASMAPPPLPVCLPAPPATAPAPPHTCRHKSACCPAPAPLSATAACAPAPLECRSAPHTR